MTSVIPPRFLFRWSCAVPYCPELSAESGSRDAFSLLGNLPDLSGFDGEDPFATISLAWNEQGLGISIAVTGKKLPVTSDLLKPEAGDVIHLWFDTRCTQNVHRATRFCHHFCVLPVGMGRNKQSPSITLLPISQAREETGKRGDSAIAVTTTVLDDGYRVQLWFPTESLHGFDPQTHPRLGFYAVVHDTELGTQFLTVGREFPFDFDPSMWQTLELVR